MWLGTKKSLQNWRGDQWGEKPIPSPGERVAPEGGRERNSGRNLKVSTSKQTSSKAEAREEVFRFP